MALPVKQTQNIERMRLQFTKDQLVELLVAAGYTGVPASSAELEIQFNYSTEGIDFKWERVVP